MFANLRKGVKSDLNTPHPEIFWHTAEEEMWWFSYALVQIQLRYTCDDLITWSISDRFCLNFQCNDT